MHAGRPRASRRGAETLSPVLCAGRWVSLQLARIGKEWNRAAAERMPTATGDIREIVGQPVFVPLYRLAQVCGVCV